ncbi:MAG: rhamnulokinase [Puniceicoccales bacterium]
MKKVYLAIDLGAGSGRVIAGIYDGSQITLEEVNRFPNNPVNVHNGMYWSLFAFYREVLTGIKKARARWGNDIVSAGVDTWGVDYGHFSPVGELIGSPRCYRDPRTDGMVEAVRKVVSGEEIYARTGIQTMALNTIYQLYAEKLANSATLNASDRLLFMPDIINFFLTGQMVNERTIASTTQLYNPNTGDWDHELIAQLGLPDQIFGSIVDPGVPLGDAMIDGEPLPIVTVGAHDTASAVAAVPMEHARSAYLSSGTWSLLGQELSNPIINEDSARENFTNEVGVDDTIRFLKNITGMWLVQECKREWDHDRETPLDFGELAAAARESDPFVAFIDADDPSFATPGNMPQRINDYLKSHQQPMPASHGQIVRVIYESLALKYKHTMKKMVALTGQEVDVLHMVGGGCQNDLLNQFTANALGIPVKAGPVEATALGNILMQMKVDGAIGTLSDGRRLVANSFATKTFEPHDAKRWDEAYTNFIETLKLS